MSFAKNALREIYAVSHNFQNANYILFFVSHAFSVIVCVIILFLDEHGVRRPGVHWVFSVAITTDDPRKVRFYPSNYNLWTNTLLCQWYSPACALFLLILKKYNSYVAPQPSDSRSAACVSGGD